MPRSRIIIPGKMNEDGASVPTHHLLRHRRGFAVSCSATFRKTNFNKSTSLLAEKDTLALAPAASDKTKSNGKLETADAVARDKEPVQVTTTTSGAGVSVSGKPATFVCEGIEVNFDSDDEVPPWKPIKVLKKMDKGGGVVDSRIKTVSVIAKTQSQRNDQSLRNEHNYHFKGAVSSQPRSVLLTSQITRRPSYVMVSNLKKQLKEAGSPLAKCAILRRPQRVLTQQVRPRIREAPHPQPNMGMARFLNPSPCPEISDKCGPLTKDEGLIIDDVLDLMEEVEKRLP